MGNKEKEAGTVAVRTLDGTVKYGLSQAEFLETVEKHIGARKLEPIVF